MKEFVNIFIVILCVINCIQCSWDGSSKIKLSDLKTLTLYYGRMTTSRRSAPVPQLKCVGGTAGCSAFVPRVVQCYNRGSDGYDAQWECKTDMDNAYRFGTVEVTCEGYDYPDDPYVVKGSCGLEYTLDLTKEGYQQQTKSHNYGYQNWYPGTKKTSLGDVIFLIIVAIIIYAIYKTCLHVNQYSPRSGDYPSDDNYFSGGFRPTSAPPPPGFTSYPPGGCGASTMGPTGSTHGGSNRSFWTGALTGGILGYMFGNSRNSAYTTQPHYSSRSYSNWSTPSSSHDRPSNDSSSGTRTSSGFGGTRRR